MSLSPRNRFLPAAILAGTLLVSPCLVAPSLAAEEAPGTFEFEALNRVYDEPVPAAAPFEQGPLVVRLESVRHDVELLSHRLELTPDPDGGQRALLVAEIQGSADVVAEIELSGMPTRFEDTIILPLQTVVIAGLARFEPTADGYRVVAEELPETVELAIESRLGGLLVSLCQGFGFLPMAEAGCDGLAAGLSTVNVPLPEAGVAIHLASAEVGAEEVAALAAYLGH